jgi:hypothetical protein
MSEEKHTASPQDAPQTSLKPDDRARAIAEAERIRELRERLYSRGNVPAHSMRHDLEKHEINEVVEKPIPRIREEALHVAHTVHTPVPASTISEESVLYDEPMVTVSKRSSYRKRIALIGLVFFIAAVATSAVIMLRGNNTVSGENISLEVTGSIATGGGEELPFQVTVSNQNSVPIQSATLIIEYPKGTHSAEDDKEISVERKQLDTIGAGEVVNVPLKARMFGEENEEKEIKVSIDYRISGSNATFHKEATPLHFKVSSSPVVMTFDSVKSITSGQEIELKLTVQSNSPAPLSDLLVKATYPEGFDFTSSDPDRVSGEDTWKIGTLKPAEKKIIKIKGLMTGYADEKRRFVATAGVSNETDLNTLASMLAKAQTDIVIEEPFLDVKVLVNGNPSESVVMSSTDSASVEIVFENTLDTAIYDGKIFAELSGNALNEFEVHVINGFYNSTDNTITWDGVDEETLKEILPGKISRLNFVLDPKDDIGRAPELKLKVTVRGQRVFEDKPAQELVGTVLRTVKVESVPTLSSSAYFASGPFVNTGASPPVAEKVTQYTYTLKVKTGTNDITGAEVTAVLPQYVSWLDLVTEGDAVTYTSNTRMIKWTIGDVDANTEKEVSMQVSFLPSLSQVGTTPTILEAQRFKATDRFTGTVVRADQPALTTSLYNESDEALKDGRVKAE